MNRTMSAYAGLAIVSFCVSVHLSSVRGQVPQGEFGEPPPSIEQMIDKVRQGRGAEKEKAVDGIAEVIRQGRASEGEVKRGKSAIHEALKSADPVVRGRAVHRLGEIEGEAATDSIMPLLSDSEEHVRQKALHFLGIYGRPDAVEDVEKLLEVRARLLGPKARKQDPTLIVGARTLARMRARGKGVSLKSILDEEWRKEQESLNNKNPIPRP